METAHGVRRRQGTDGAPSWAVLRAPAPDQDDRAPVSTHAGDMLVMVRAPTHIRTDGGHRSPLARRRSAGRSYSSTSPEYLRRTVTAPGGAASMHSRHRTHSSRFSSTTSTVPPAPTAKMSTGHT